MCLAELDALAADLGTPSRIGKVAQGVASNMNAVDNRHDPAEKVVMHAGGKVIDKVDNRANDCR